MSNELADKLEALEKLAPPAPWHIDMGGGGWYVMKQGAPGSGFIENIVFDDGSSGGEYNEKCSLQTRDFLLALRNAFPQIISALRSSTRPEELRVPRGMVLVCATCRFPPSEDHIKTCDSGEACPHKFGVPQRPQHDEGSK